MLEMLADLKNKGQKVLFNSGEMNKIDMYGYVKRYPKVGQLDILGLQRVLRLNDF